MKKPNDFEKYILGVVKKYAPLMLLQRHTIGVRAMKDGEAGYMACQFRFPYLDTTILYSKKSLEDFNEGVDMKSAVIHELCHIITDPLYAMATTHYVSREQIEDHRENVTDHIANIVLGLV